MKTLTQSRTSPSLRSSLVFHIILLALAFIPFAAQIPAVKIVDNVEIMLLPALEEESPSIVQERIVQFEESVENGSGSASPADEIIPESVEPDIASTEIVSAEENVAMDTASTSSGDIIAIGGASESGTGESESGEEGTGEGVGPGDNGNGGSGVLTRKVIYRPDIAKAAKENGQITLNVCINRQGKVKSVKYDEALTTIQNPQLVKECSMLALEYGFEPDLMASESECGKLTFKFTINSNLIEVEPS